MSVDVLQSFAGLAPDPSHFSSPPSPNIAVGPRHVIEIVQEDIAFFNKNSGQRLSSQHLQDFFAAVGAAAVLNDPVVAYDELAQRFVVIAQETGALFHTGSQSSFLYFAVSNSSNPLDGFSEMQRIDLKEFHGSQALWGDWSRLGWNADGYVVTLNMTTFDNFTFHHTQVVSIAKSSVLDTNPATFTFFKVDRENNKHFTMQPAIMHGSAPGDSMWFVEADTSTNQGRDILVVRMTNILSPAPTFTDSRLAVPRYDDPPNATQPGTGLIKTDDFRILSAALRGNRLVASQTVGTPRSDSVAHARWYEFDIGGTSPTVSQVGEIDRGPGVHTYYPSIDISAGGDLGMTFMESGSNEFLSVYVTGQRAGEPSGLMQAPVLVKAGEATYTPAIQVAAARAGHYSGTAIDPVNDTFWSVNEYATPPHPPTDCSRLNFPPCWVNWGTWIANFSMTAGAPALLAASTPAHARVASITTAQEQPLLAESFHRWQAAGVDTSALGNIQIQITDLPGATLGLASGHTIYLDSNAAGWGWFVDPTPADDSEFTTPGNQGEMNRIDLLTALEHELGHILGLDHTDWGLMSQFLATGVRETPTVVLDQFFATLG